MHMYMFYVNLYALCIMYLHHVYVDVDVSAYVLVYVDVDVRVYVDVDVDVYVDVGVYVI